MQRRQQAEGQRQAVLQAQKASHRHRSRLERALGTPVAEHSAAELDGDDYDGLPEDGLSQLPDRWLLTPLLKMLSLSVYTLPKHALAASQLLTPGCLLPSIQPHALAQHRRLLARSSKPQQEAARRGFACPCREEEPGEEYRYEAEEEQEEEEPWEYDSEALKQWEQFVKKSKAVQVYPALTCFFDLLGHRAAIKQCFKAFNAIRCGMLYEMASNVGKTWRSNKSLPRHPGHQGMPIRVLRDAPGQARQLNRVPAVSRCLMPTGGIWVQQLWMPEQWPSPKRLATGMPDLPRLDTLRGILDERYSLLSHQVYCYRQVITLQWRLTSLGAFTLQDLASSRLPLPAFIQGLGSML